jgi:Kef-type K+ transport system membrane component KefB
MDIFTEISIIIAITFVISGILHLLKQPLVIGYIFSGIIVGPSLLNLVTSPETMGIFAHIGIALLLFTVGLSLNPRMIKDVGKVSIITGLGQVIFTSGIGFLIATALGFSTIVSLYIAVALTFSSTIIIMKLLSDKGDTDTLYGKIAIGFLLIQDLVVVLVLIVVASLSGGFSLQALAFGLLVKGVGLLGAILWASYYILPRVTKLVAKSQEFLLLFSIGWCMVFASLTYALGFSIEIGALLAGVTLAMSPYRYEISSKMRPLRDFFIVLFFILLGSQMEFLDISTQIVPIAVFSTFILIGNPIIVMSLMGMLGYTKRNSFLAGLTVAQISEFSLIFISLGISVGHLSKEVLSLVTVVGLITIAGSTYMILYADKLYVLLERYLSIFERSGKKVDDHKYKGKGSYDIILFGYNRIGFDILKAFESMKR